MKGKFEEQLMPFFKAAEVVKALRWAEFRSVPGWQEAWEEVFVDKNALHRPPERLQLDIEESNCNAFSGTHLS